MQPTKKTLYILIACVISLIAISYAKIQTQKINNLLNLETSSSTAEYSNQDYLGLENNPETTNTYTATSGVNLTDEFSKSFFAKYYTMSSESDLTTSDSQSIIEQSINAYKSIDLGNPAHFTFVDLKIVKSNEANLKYFANSFVTEEGKCLDEISRIAKSTQDPIKTGTLYKNCANTLVKIPITQELNQNYLNVVNNFYLLGEKMSSLEAAKSDPLRALVIIKEIGVLEGDRSVFYQNISSLLKKSGIIFSNEEPGKAWFGNAQ